jgi:type VI secretion system protein ImpB
MADSFQKEKPPSRINLFLELQEGEAKEKVELPMRLLVLGDYTGREDQTPVEEREVVNINSDNFESVMRSKDLKAEYTVENKLDEDGDDIAVDLSFEDMDSFSPENVARQVPQLRRMVAMRNLLQDLRNRVVSTSEFRKQLEQIVQDESAMSELAEELKQVVTAPEASADEASDDESGAESDDSDDA